MHSVAASTVGTAFILGVVIVTLRRRRNDRAARVFDVIALVAAAGVPMVMFNVEGIAGALQRVMFVIAYIWLGWEAVRSARIPVCGADTS